MEKERISAVILKDKKILLVTGFNEEYYWTPGGKLEAGESHEQTMRRELEEEIGVKLIKMKYYFTYKGINVITNKNQVVHCYIVNFEGEIVPRKEITKFGWFSKADFENERLKMFEEAEKNLIPKLIKDNLL